MTREEVKKILKGYRDSQRRYESAIRELEEFEAMIESVTIDYSKPKVKGGKRKELADVIDELKRMHEKADREWTESARAMVEVKELITKVKDEKCYEVVSRRYLSGQHWDTISYEMRLDKRWIFRLHDRALDEIANESA